MATIKPMGETMEKLSEIDNLRYALLEIRQSILHDNNYRFEVALAERALALAEAKYGKWTGNGMIMVHDGRS